MWASSVKTNLVFFFFSSTAVSQYILSHFTYMLTGKPAWLSKVSFEFYQIVTTIACNLFLECPGSAAGGMCRQAFAYMNSPRHAFGAPVVTRMMLTASVAPTRRDR